MNFIQNKIIKRFVLSLLIFCGTSIVSAQKVNYESLATFFVNGLHFQEVTLKLDNKKVHVTAEPRSYRLGDRKVDYRTYASLTVKNKSKYTILIKSAKIKYAINHSDYKGIKIEPGRSYTFDVRGQNRFIKEIHFLWIADKVPANLNQNHPESKAEVLLDLGHQIGF